MQRQPFWRETFQVEWSQIHVRIDFERTKQSNVKLIDLSSINNGLNLAEDFVNYVEKQSLYQKT